MLYLNNTVVIFSDNFNRDVESHWLTTKLLNQYKVYTFIVSRLTLKYFVKYFAPEILILAHCKNLNYKQYALLKNNNTKIIILELDSNYGVSISAEAVHPEFDYTLLDKILLWNVWTKNWLEENRQLETKKLEVIGLPRNQLNRPSKNRRIKNNGIINIGILTRFEHLNVFDRRPPQSLFENKGGTTRAKLMRLHVDVDAMSLLVNLFKYLCKTDNNILLRVHPNESKGTYRKFFESKNYNISIDSSATISEWLGNVDLVIGPYNSGLVDAYISKVPAICIDNMLEHHIHEEFLHVPQSIYNSCYMPENYQELIDLINSKNITHKKSKLMDEFLYNMYNYTEEDNNSINKLVDVTKAVLAPNKFNFIVYIKFKYALISLLIYECFTLSKLLIKKLIKNRYNSEPIGFHYLRILYKPSQFIRNIFSQTELHK